MYSILYIDGLRVRIKDNGVVTTKVVYLAIGVDVDGRKQKKAPWVVFICPNTGSTITLRRA